MPAPVQALARVSAPPRGAAAPRRTPVVAHDTRELHAGLVALVPELRARATRLCGDASAGDDVVQD